MEQAKNQQGTGPEVTAADLDAIRAAIATTPPDALGGLFSLLAESLGKEEASRLWMAAFASTDAAET